jgi:hypothetical protein
MGEWMQVRGSWKDGRVETKGMRVWLDISVGVKCKCKENA